MQIAFETASFVLWCGNHKVTKKQDDRPFQRDTIALKTKLARWASLTSLVRSTNFTARQLHFRKGENFTASPWE